MRAKKTSDVICLRNSFITVTSFPSSEIFRHGDLSSSCHFRGSLSVGGHDIILNKVSDLSLSSFMFSILYLIVACRAV